MNRPDFEYTCECGYWLCLDCGTPWYPMEVESNPETGDYECPECLGRVEFRGDGETKDSANLK